MQNKGSDRINDASTTFLREYIWQASLVVTKYLFFRVESFSPLSLKFAVWLHALCLLHNIRFFYSDIHQHNLSQIEPNQIRW